MRSVSSAVRSCSLVALVLVAALAVPAGGEEDAPRPQVAPFIVSTSPSNATLSVPLDSPLVVTFSETMVPFTDPTGKVTVQPATPVNLSWSAGDTVLTITPLPAWTNCTVYRVQVFAVDLDESLDLVPGPVPNPWTFMTVSDCPYITFQDPKPGETNVRPDRPILVHFSEPMNATSVRITRSPPNTGVVLTSWDGTITELTATTTFQPGTTYTINVEEALDPDGNGLVGSFFAQNPWTFTTNALPVVSAPTVNPLGCLNGGSGVSVAWTMSDAEDSPENLTVTLQYLNGTAWETFAGPTTGFSSPASYAWSLPAFDLDTRVRVQVEDSAGGAAEMEGTAFRIDTGSPTLSLFLPGDGATDVNVFAPISLIFSEPMERTSVDVSVTPEFAGTPTFQWTGDDDVLSIIPSTGLLALTTYTVTLSAATDTCPPGRPMANLPMTFTFTTGRVKSHPPAILRATEVTDTSVTLSWSAVTTLVTGQPIPPGAEIGYVVYVSLDETVLGTALDEISGTALIISGLDPSTTYTFRVVAIVDGLPSDPTSPERATTRPPFLETQEGQISLLVTAIILLFAAAGGMWRLQAAKRKQEEEELEEEVREIVAAIREVRAERDLAERRRLESDLRDRFQALAGRVEDGDESFKPSPRLEGLYRALAESLVQSPEVDMSKGRRVVDDRLGSFVSTLAAYGAGYRLLSEAEASVESNLFAGLPESGRKALLLVYFYALEEYLSNRLRVLVPAGATLLLGERGHINTRKRGWETQFNSLSLGNMAYLIGHNRHLFVKASEAWETEVEPLLQRAVDARNRTAHPSRQAPPLDRVRELVYRSLVSSERALKIPEGTA